MVKIDQNLTGPIDINKILYEMEVNYIKKALRIANYNIREAAKLLGINRTTLHMQILALKILTEDNQPVIQPRNIKSKTIYDYDEEVKPVKTYPKIVVPEKVSSEKHKYLIDHKNSVEDQLW